MIPKIHPSNFTGSIWRGGTMCDLGVKKYRKSFIVEKKKALRKYAIGYCKSESLFFRPKKDNYAVMFQKGVVLFWTHLTAEEFKLIFI